MTRATALALVAALATTGAVACSPTETVDTSGSYFTLTEQHNLPDTVVATVGSIIPISFLVTHNGVALGGVTLTWTAKGGDSRIVTPSAASDSTGVATGTWVLSDSVGFDTLGIQTSSGIRTFYAHTVPGSATLITRLVADSMSVAVGTPTTLAVQATDARNNLVTNANVTWSATGGTLSAPASASNTNGRAEISFIPSAPGVYRITATLPGEASTVFTVVAT